jgi:hypothetical protein
MTATWTVNRVPAAEVTAEFLLGIARRHRMVFDNPNRMVDYYRAICRDCIVLELLTDSGEKAADVIISEIVDGEEAVVDLVVVSKHYARIAPDGSESKVPFLDMTRDALVPLFDRLTEARGLRRLTAYVPKSRSRTVHALTACGFDKEGVKRNAIKFAGKEPEGLVIMGRLAKG